MPKHDDLQFLELGRTTTKQDELEHAAEREVPERQEQGQLLGISGTGAPTVRPAYPPPSRNRVNAPHTLPMGYSTTPRDLLHDLIP
jgi:hypothetical protein